MLDKLKSAKEKLSEGLEKLQEYSVDKLQEQLEHLSQAMPIVEEAGWQVMKLDVSLVPTPKLVPHFQQIEPLDRERVDRVIAEHPEKKLLKPLLMALVKSCQIRDAIQLKELTFSAVAIEAGMPPGVKLIFTR